MPGIFTEIRSAHLKIWGEIEASRDIEKGDSDVPRPPHPRPSSETAAVCERAIAAESDCPDLARPRLDGCFATGLKFWRPVH